MNIHRHLFILVIIFFSLFGIAKNSLAATEFYVDPTYNGVTMKGTSSYPWTSLANSGAWAAINSALASGDVTVYFSARSASADINEQYNAGIDLINRTDTGPNRLTLDGGNYFNQNDSSPAWVVQSGSGRAEVWQFMSENAEHQKYSNITIQNFHIVAQPNMSNGKAITICGDNWIIKNNDISFAPGTYNDGDGPTILTIPTTDAAHGGTDFYCPPFTNLQIMNNKIHDGVGECIYLGGGECLNSDATGNGSECGGFPSHNNITISGNEIHNCASKVTPGSQGDGVDIKGGITNLTVSQNHIYNLSDPAGVGVRGIVSQGMNIGGQAQNNVIEKNIIENIKAEDAAIALVTSYGTPNGVTIRNNVINGITHGGGIQVYDGSAIGIYNNTIYNTTSYGLYSPKGVITVKNNSVFHCYSDGHQTNLNGTITSSNNAYSNTWNGSEGADCGANCVSGLSSVTGVDFVSPGTNFALTANSKCANAGAAISGYNDDILGISRPQGSNWDIGAYEYRSGNSDTTPPATPTGLVVN